MLKQHLFLLCGLPFSGKSTMGRALAERLGVVHVEVDRHHAGGRDGFDGRRVERAEWIAAYQAAYREVEVAIAEGSSVVFDAVSFRRNQRDRIRRLAVKHDVPMTIIYLDVAPEEAMARLTRNRDNPSRANVPVEDFAEVASGMEPPQADEAVAAYRPDEPIAEWIDRTIRPMLKETDT